MLPPKEARCAVCHSAKLEAYVLGAMGEPVWLCRQHLAEAQDRLPVVSRDAPIQW